MLRPGKYWIGDLCYVMSDVWDEFCDKTIVEHNCIDGEMIIAGKLIAQYKTKYGDGLYRDENGNNYGVDAGLIGCIRVEDITDPKADLKLGRVVEFNRSFRTGSDEDGVIFFDDVRIATGDSAYDDYDDEE